MGQKACSPSCAVQKVRTDKKRERKRETKAAKDRLKTRSEWAKEAQTAFNAWVRERDYGEPCISCGTTNPSTQYCAGHYRTVGACPELRFEPLNVHLQCNRNCNMAKSGNITEYRINLVKKIGAEKVEWLEGPHEPKHYTVEDLKEIKKEYSRKARELKKAREASQG
jgi:hypothetical protein